MVCTDGRVQEAPVLEIVTSLLGSALDRSNPGSSYLLLRHR